MQAADRFDSRETVEFDLYVKTTIVPIVKRELMARSE